MSSRSMPLLLDWLLQPLGLVFSGLLISQLSLLWSSGASRILTLVMALSTALLWVCSAPLTANAIVWRMEKPTHVIDAQCAVEKNDGIASMPVVVLGADLDAYSESSNPYEVLSHESLLRTLHAASLDTGQNRFFLMGGGQTSRKLSDFMARVLTDRGVDSSRIVLDKNSLSTHANAQQLATLIDPVTTVPIVLVTSSLHMNRAVTLFAQQGFTVCPNSAGSLYSVSAGWVGLLPYIDGLTKTTYAWRELLATIKLRALTLAGR